MSASFSKAAQSSSPSRVTENSQVQQRALRDGSNVTVDWMQAAVMEGRVHGANHGTGTTPVATNATYADAEQDFYLYVPAGTVIIPLSIQIAMEDTGTILVTDTLAGYSSNGDSAVTGTALTVRNFKTLGSSASNCTATAVVTSGGATHLGGTDYLEFWRPYAGLVPDHLNAAAAVNMDGDGGPNGASWSAKTSIAPGIGSTGTDCALSVFAAFQAGIGYITVIWAEYDAADFS